MADAHWTYTARDESDTDRLGAALAGLLREGAIVALSGELGAGKTRLVQAIAEAFGVDRREVVSPTFVLVHEYAGRCPIFHFDVYRLRDVDEFEQLGPHEYFAPPNVVLIEWAERVAAALPEERLEISIRVGPEEQRVFDVAARGGRYAAVVDTLRQELGGP